MTIATSVYRNYSPAGQGIGVMPLVENARVLAIDFGSGDLLRAGINTVSNYRTTSLAAPALREVNVSFRPQGRNPQGLRENSRKCLQDYSLLRSEEKSFSSLRSSTEKKRVSSCTMVLGVVTLPESVAAQIMMPMEQV
ncbi:MAG: hypothetical protein FWF31_01780 [Desulfobulbus sp.]|nr:hypothetical protein [Desulfobulbus sp.]